jgi:hypothetical protein
MKVKTPYLAIIFQIILISSACNKPIFCSESSVYESAFSFYLVNKDFISIIDGYGSIIHKSEDVRLASLTNEEPRELKINGGGRVIVSIPQDEELPIDSLASDTILIILPPYHLNQYYDTDTVVLNYKIIKNDCPPLKFDGFTVFYNDSLYYTGEFKPNFNF